MLKANDRQRCDSAVRTLVQDKAAIVQLRAQWSRLFPGRPPEALSAQDLVRVLHRELSTGALQAVLLRSPRMPIAPADITQVTSGVINVGTGQRRLLIARKGTLPPDVLGFANPGAAIEALGQIRDGDETARQIDGQASRLSPDGRGTLNGKLLRQSLARQIGSGALDAAVITHAPAATAIAARPDAATPISKMSDAEKIGEALKRSLPYAIEAGGEAIRQAVEDMLKPESILIMAGMAVLVAAAHVTPLTGAAVDTTLVLLAWWNGGNEAVEGLGRFAMATLDARDAGDEKELDAAARAYGKALGAMGPKLLSAIVGRFLPKKGGAGSSGGKVSVSGAKTGGGKKATGPSKGKAGKPVRTSPKFGKRSTGTEKGATPADAKTLREIRRAKLRENKTLSKEGWPDIPGRDVKTFKSYPEPKELPEGTKIYRVIDSESNPNGAFWTTQNPAKMSEGQWRSGAAVKGEWNGDGAYVEYEVPKGGLKVWSGEAAPQISSDGKNVLSGGGNQLWIAQDKLSATSVSKADAISTGWGQ